MVELFESIRDAEGRIVLGDPAKGCRHCGHVEIKAAANGKSILHHPGVECCANTIRDQIRYRAEEVASLQTRQKEDEERVKRLTEEADMYGRDSKSQQAHTARWLEERAQKGLAGKQRLYGEDLRALTGDINRLKAKLKAVQK